MEVLDFVENNEINLGKHMDTKSILLRVRCNRLETPVSSCRNAFLGRCFDGESHE